MVLVGYFYIFEKNKTMQRTETALVHQGEHFNTTSAVVSPIFQTSTYYADNDLDIYIEAATATKHPTFYHRHGNPTNSQVAELLAHLEQTEDALVLATGMAAISTAVLAAVQAGDHVIAQHAHYSGASLFLREFLADYGVAVTFVDQTDNEAIAAAIRPETKLIYVETPSNPNLAITDLAFVGKLGKEHGILTMVDNTFSSPINQQPHVFGIDVILHSATKYLGGHSDLTAGAVCGTKVFIDKVWKRSLVLGASLSPFDSWLLLRGLKTLALRVRQINENALQLAQWLDGHQAVRAVTYVGLPSHPQHALAKEQMRGFTGMLCIELEGAGEADQFAKAQQLLGTLKVFSNAASLGGVESLIVHPASMWGGHHAVEQKTIGGIKLGLLRISVGIEHIDDLLADLAQGLAKLS